MHIQQVKLVIKKNGFIYNYNYELDYDKYTSILIQLDNTHYLILYYDIYIFELFEPIIKFTSIYYNFGNPPIGTILLLTNNYAYNLYNKIYRPITEMPTNLDDYLDTPDRLTGKCFLDDPSMEHMIIQYIHIGNKKIYINL